ncbi:hypothetical protein BDV93DRAFT_227561 [Ceratobasidium sp. AG-I]|nr:hypothetical protein BDV93DRAFT_227561 [Ceratobasidium sp. AG-I]
MSAELSANTYLYRPKYRPKKRSQDKGSVLSKSPFVQNFLHDAESLWWVALWCLARLDPVGRDLSQNKEAHQRRIEQYLEWFPREARTLGNAFDEPLNLADYTEFTGTELPEAYRPIWEALDAWRITVTEQIYATQYVQGGSIEPSGMEDLHVKTRVMIKTKDLLSYTRKVGKLELVVGFE